MSHIQLTNSVFRDSVYKQAYHLEMGVTLKGKGGKEQHVAVLGSLAQELYSSIRQIGLGFLCYLWPS